MIASADRQTSVFRLIATLNHVSRALLLGSNPRAGCSLSSVGTRASFSMRLSQATHSLFRDLRVTEFPAVRLQHILESLSSQKKYLYGQRIQVRPAGKLSQDYLREE
jgi:hypothetical protein